MTQTKWPPTNPGRFRYEYRLVDIQTSHESKRLEFLSEVNGPLLIFVPSEHETSFRKAAPEDITHIGEWRRD